MEPRMRTVDAEGREAGEKAWRWEGMMRGVASDMSSLVDRSIGAEDCGAVEWLVIWSD